jgi:hypothetical protein
MDLVGGSDNQKEYIISLESDTFLEKKKKVFRSEMKRRKGIARG